MLVEIKLAYKYKAAIIELFNEYTRELASIEASFGSYLSLQGYSKELEDLEGKYGLPDCRLYIALAGGQAAGCVALKRHGDGACEMKRLYVKPEFRNLSIARQLTSAIIQDAKGIGYTHMLLDTLPSLVPAIKLYESIGFYRIGPYNDSPVENTIFMRLDLA